MKISPQIKARKILATCILGRSSLASHPFNYTQTTIAPNWVLGAPVTARMPSGALPKAHPVQLALCCCCGRSRQSQSTGLRKQQAAPQAPRTVRACFRLALPSASIHRNPVGKNCFHLHSQFRTYRYCNWPYQIPFSQSFVRGRLTSNSTGTLAHELASRPVNMVVRETLRAAGISLQYHAGNQSARQGCTPSRIVCIALDMVALVVNLLLI